MTTIVTIDMGGTGATHAAGAREALSVPSMEQMGHSYAQANNARDQANAAYAAANTAAASSVAYDQANTARTQANTARTQANNAYAAANTAQTTAQNAYAEANTAETIALNAYGQANSARDQANTARSQANTAYGQANAAYGAANTRLSASGGTLSGDLIITGNLTVSGNQTILNTEVLTTEDADIVLLSNTSSTPALNAGLIVNRGTSTNTFLRWNEALDEWGWSDNGTTTYYFEDLRSGLSTTNTTFGTINTSLGTINTSYQAAYAQANTARTQGNTAYSQANSAYSQANSARDQANTGYGQANAAYGQANAAYTRANTKLDSSGGTISGNLVVTGSLTVSGNVSSINTQSISSVSNEIILNSNASGSPTLDGKLTINRGSSPNVTLLWNETADKWGWTDNGTTYYYLEDLRSGLATHNTTFGTINTSLGTINTSYQAAYAQANTAGTNALNAYGQANAAYGAANNRVLKAGDTMTGGLIIQADASNEQLIIKRATNTNEQLIFGFNSSDYGSIQAVEQNVSYRPLILNKDGGDVAIGAAPPAFTSGSGLEIQRATATATLRLDSSSFATELYGYTGGTGLFQLSAGYLDLGTNNTTRLRITSDGNVAIGTTTATALLTVGGDQSGTAGSIVSGYNKTMVIGANNYNVGYNSGNAIMLMINSYSNDTGDNVYPIYVEDENNVVDFFLWAGNDTLGTDKRAYFGGKVGIGTSTPNGIVHIVTTSNTTPMLRMETTGNSTNTAFWIEDQDANPAAKTIATMDLSSGTGLFNLYAGAYTLGGANYYGSTRGASRIRLHDDSIITYISSSSTGTADSLVTWYQTLEMSNSNFIVYTNNGTERLRVNSSGNLGVGNNAPDFKTIIQSDITKSGDINPGSAHLSLQGNSDVRKRMILGYDTNSNGFGFIKAGFFNNAWTTLSLQPDGGNVGIGTTSGAEKLHVVGNIVATGSITASYSDARFKDIISRIENPLHIISNIDTIFYRPNELVKSKYPQQEDRVFVGVTAQSVKEVLPEVVVPSPIDPEYDTVHYDRLVPVLIAAIQEQQKQIEELRNKVGL